MYPGLSKKKDFFLFSKIKFLTDFFIFSMFMLQFLKVNIIFLYWFPKMGGGVLQPLQRAQHFQSRSPPLHGSDYKYTFQRHIHTHGPGFTVRRNFKIFVSNPEKVMEGCVGININLQIAFFINIISFLYAQAEDIDRYKTFIIEKSLYVN